MMTFQKLTRKPVARGNWAVRARRIFPRAVGAWLLFSAVVAPPSSAWAGGFAACRVFSDPAISSRVPEEARANSFTTALQSGETLVATQRQALRVVALTASRSKANLAARAVARAKIDLFPEANLGEASRTALGARGSAELQRDALEFILRNFDSEANGDHDLRAAAIVALGQSAVSDLASIEALLPIARGVSSAGPDEFFLAAAAVREIHQRLAGATPDVYLTARDYAAPEHEGTVRERLRGARVESVKPISAGNNVNSTWIVTLATRDGSRVRGVFKPLIGESGSKAKGQDRILFTREIQAYDFYHEFFRHPDIQAPETLEVILRNSGQSLGVGSFQLFAEGARTLNEWYLGNQPAQSWMEYGRVWERQKQDPRWHALEAWIRVFDWSLSNTDRFPNSRYGSGNPNNMLMKEADGPGSRIQAILIDNGNGRRPRPGTEFGEQDIPLVSDWPRELVARVIAFNEAKLAQLRVRFAGSISPAGVEEIIRRLRVLRGRAMEYVDHARGPASVRATRRRMPVGKIAVRGYAARYEQTREKIGQIA